MTTIDQYGPLFLAAFAALHGGHPDEPPEPVTKRPGESPADFLERSRGEGLERLQVALAAARPPRELRAVQEALVRLLAAAIEADQAMAEQVESYNRGDTEASLHHAERVANLVAESIRLDRELILALQAAEKARRGTLDALGLAELLPRSS